MQGANTRQVGGDHYQSDYQHWDWSEEIDLDPLLYAATKYLTRWRNKNGVADIEKAIHYVDKRMENAGRLAGRRARINLEHIRTETGVFLNDNPQIPPSEHMIFIQLAVWQSRKQLATARNMLENLLQQEREAAAVPQPAEPVIHAGVSDMKFDPSGYVNPRAG